MHMQGMLRKQQGLPNPNKQKRKRSAPLPPAQHVEALTCARHIDAAAEDPDSGRVSYQHDDCCIICSVREPFFQFVKIGGLPPSFWDLKQAQFLADPSIDPIGGCVSYQCRDNCCILFSVCGEDPVRFVTLSGILYNSTPSKACPKSCNLPRRPRTTPSPPSPSTQSSCIAASAS